MVRMVGILGLTVLLAAGAALLAGCFGVSQNPSYFPYLLPTKDIIRTHAKPPGLGYFADFDKHAVRLEVRPIEATNPVHTQHVIIATIYDENGKPRRNRRVEWMLEGVGSIIEVDESGYFPGRGYKVDNHYAVSYTDYFEHTITRHNDNPNDDFSIRPGQTWCVISAPVEGDSHVTVYAPEIANWDHHKVFVTKHWVDAEWIFPKPAVNRAGTQHVFTTSVFRHTDHEPLQGYRVRYRILDGPPAMFLPSGRPEAVIESNLQGHANVTLAQVAPVPGINRIGVEIIRAPDPTLPSGSGLVIARGETSKEWQAPSIALAKTGPATAAVGQEIPYTLTVNNTGQVETQALTVRDAVPDSFEYLRSDPPATLTANELVWTLGALPGHQSRNIQVVFRSTRVGLVTNRANVVTEEGLKDEKSVNTNITLPETPGIKVTKTGAATGIVGAKISYQITVTNPGTGPATNVLLKDSFDEGLEHETKANPVELPVGTLGPGETKTVNIDLTPRRAGTLVNRVAVTADGNLSDHAEHPVTVQEPKLTLQKTGPAWRYVGGRAVFDVRAANAGDVPLNNVVVRDVLPPELSFVSATDNGQPDAGGQVVWSLGNLAPHQERALQVTGKCTRMTPRTVNTASASADGGIQAQSEAPLEIRGLPGFRLEVFDTDDPVEVGNKTTYKIAVTNQGSLPGNGVQITAQVPDEMQIVSIKGPSNYKVDGQKITFDPVNGVQPKALLDYSIEVQAVRPGDVRFRAWLSGGTLSSPVLEEESTNIIPAGPAPPPMPPAGAAPAPVPGGGAAADLPSTASSLEPAATAPGSRVPIATTGSVAMPAPAVAPVSDSAEPPTGPPM